MAKGRYKLKGQVKTLLPVATATVLTGATTLGLRAYLRPEPGQMSEKLYRFAPIIGVGAGLLGAAGLYFMGGGKRGGMEGATIAAVTSLGAGMLLFASERLNAAKAGALNALGGSAALPSGDTGLPGLSALLPESAQRYDGLGQIVMEPLNGAYGDSVNVNGLGAGYNPNAFGQRAF